MTYDLIKISALPAATPDESQDIVVGVGDYAKRINYGDVKADMVGTSPSYTTDTEPYLMRQTAHTGVVGKCALNKLVGGSLGWNQLITTLTGGSASGITVTANASSGSITASGTATANGNVAITDRLTILANHKYLLKGSKGAGKLGMAGGSQNDNGNGAFLAFSTTATRQIFYVFSSGQTLSETLYPQLFDLTAMFGSTIADYVYSLGVTSGVAWLRKYIDIDSYHAYDAGSIQSVQATAHVTTGFNQFDEVVEAGYWDATTGQKASGGNWMRCANYIPVLPNTEYMIHFTSGSGSQGSLIYLDGNKSVISYISSYISAVITTPSNCRYMVFYANNGWFGGNICINISKTTGTPKNGDYVPYNGHSYSLGSDTLRGIPQLVSNKLAFDGDEKYPDGTIKRRYGIANIDDLTFTYDSTNKWLMGSSALPNSISSTTAMPNSMTDMPYDAVAANTLNVNTKAWTLYTGKVVVKDSSLTEVQLRAAISGKHIVYPLATPTTESSTSYQKVQTIDADGTESFTVSSPVPVGHETQTPDNILAALGWLGE